ncbi:hypothetical protein [Acidipropionibacterium jensenii]|nr:hypothetical protein [Acidipropionibacterium jensenii]MDN5976961.1 hypothetical protein [Acidipropionibacterium jensenii]MDN5995840.1 hypothetical protein [Acidipropionibacterium jensenii]MDN6022241.1 hypothetical protein [Acidipropionibacterium jensenii]MDN6426126.1 hypothetical protein [Acidipropionibacterium jensenii]MDN6441333.1 hypothetical protein [Acidipropionibacterium jensenii]
MMKTLKLVLIVLGAVALGVGLYMTISVGMAMDTIMAAARSSSGGAGLTDPTSTIWTVAGVSLACGLLIGLGVGLPRQTNSSVRKATLRGAAEQRERSIRDSALRQGGAGIQPPTGEPNARTTVESIPTTGEKAASEKPAPELGGAESGAPEDRQLTAGDDQSPRDDDAAGPEHTR